VNSFLYIHDTFVLFTHASTSRVCTASVTPVMRANIEIPFADSRQLDFARCSIQRSNIADDVEAGYRDGRRSLCCACLRERFSRLAKRNVHANALRVLSRSRTRAAPRTGAELINRERLGPFGALMNIRTRARARLCDSRVGTPVNFSLIGRENGLGTARRNIPSNLRGAVPSPSLVPSPPRPSGLPGYGFITGRDARAPSPRRASITAKDSFPVATRIGRRESV